jgi:hypothetical protein
MQTTLLYADLTERGEVAQVFHVSEVLGSWFLLVSPSVLRHLAGFSKHS